MVERFGDAPEDDSRSDARAEGDGEPVPGAQFGFGVLAAEANVAVFRKTEEKTDEEKKISRDLKSQPKSRKAKLTMVFSTS
jgi:hypothetical protein